MRLRRTVGAALATGALLAVSSPAAAFSTRVHIALANEVRDAIIAGGGQAAALRFGAHAVQFSAQDADAIVNHPLEFRAGAVGPDNTAFPGMTDPSHAIGQRPFEQCQLLYEAALLPAERAYALGCFLHGSTDAVAHHYVNFLTGETFTLNPVTSNRAFSLDNVTRHITAETMIQNAILTAKPDAFTTGKLAHVIPKSFVQRAYFNLDSPLWKLVAHHAKGKLDAAKAANPSASLVTILQSADIAPAEHLVLTPIYLSEIDQSRVALRASIEQTIKDLQNPATADGATLGVTAGSDGQLGTSDDQTACSATCASLYAKYKVYVALLAPRFDAGNNPLPSAFDKLSVELALDLARFTPAYLDTVENLSDKLNEPITADSDGFAVSKADVAQAFAPLTTWGNDLTNIDYTTLTQAVVPDWLISLQNALNAVGVNVSIPNLIAALLDPVIAPIKDAVKQYAIDQAQAFIGELVEQYKLAYPSAKSEFEARLLAAAPAGAAGTALDYVLDSGLFGHSVNVALVAMADSRSVLPVGEDPIGIGPATFDASYVVSWMQVGVCPYLRDAVFPLGIDVAGALSVRLSDGTTFTSTASEDSPVECHDGSLASFASSPTTQSCQLTDLVSLVADPAHRGTLSRAHPPELGATPATCVGIEIAGLPKPPPGLGTGGSGSGGVGSTLPSQTGSGDDGGCGCRSARGSGTGSLAWALLALALALGRRRSRGEA